MLPSRPLALLAVVADALGAASLAVAAVTVVRAAPDPTALPLGDGKLTTSGPKKGYVYSCGPHTGGGGAQVNGSWIHGLTWDSTAKVTVDGAVTWPSVRRITVAGTARKVSGNGLPAHPTGTFPVAATDDAYAVDRNPNSIKAQTLSYALPATPVAAAKPSCIQGAVGVMLTGAVLFDALDAEGRDAPAHEVQDACGGHPEITGQYHYHSLSPCMDIGTSATEHSKLVGYAADGYGIYGPRGDGGKVLATADLDACHGTTDTITWNGKQVRMYHYVLTADYPYSVSCFRGTPVRVAQGQGPGAGSRGPGAGGPGAGRPPLPGQGPGNGGPPPPPQG